MPDFINLTCPSCGGKLQITSDIDRFACGHCGNELIVRRSGGAITVEPVVEGLRKVQAGVDKTASELAIVRLEGEIAHYEGLALEALNKAQEALAEEVAGKVAALEQDLDEQRKAGQSFASQVSKLKELISGEDGEFIERILNASPDSPGEGQSDD